MGEFSVSSLFDLGGIVALLGIPYLVWSNRVKRRHFSYDFSALVGKLESNHADYTFLNDGVIKNLSEVPNSLVRVYLVVWKNAKKNSYLRFGYGGTNVTDQTNKRPLKLPIYFQPREAKAITISTTIPIKGNADERLLYAHEKLTPDSKFEMPKYRYELVFEDIDKNFFDQNGVLRNIEEANLWFTLGNTHRFLDELNIEPFLSHITSILWTKVSFSLRLLLWKIGL